MTIQAYPEIYVNKSRQLLGEAFCYAIVHCKIDATDFINMFLGSTYSKRIEKGDVACIAGQSGIELALKIHKEITLEDLPIKEVKMYSKGKEYWIGWIISYYQWHTSLSFAQILSAVPYEDFAELYKTLHEADITKAIDVINSRITANSPETRLKLFRTKLGLSQSDLSRRANVGLRSIQLYEQRKKEINKASAETIYKLALALGCRSEDLLEKNC